MKKVDAETIISWKPCKEYSAKRIKRLFGTRKFATAKQILRLDLPPRDLLWCVLRPELIDDKTRRLFACRVAERALRRECKAGRKPAAASWEAVRVAKRFANGKATEAELRKAWSAARSAAEWWSEWSAARAAGSAAKAAGLASRSAARSAASSATWPDAWSDAAYAAESALQVEQLKKMIG